MTFATSLATFETDIQNAVVETEADVQAVFAYAKQEIAVAQNLLDDAATWIVNNGPAIAAGIEEVLSLVTGLGLTASVPAIAVAVTDANNAVTALNAFVAAKGTGVTTPAAIVSGYTAFTSAQAAVASAKAAVVAAPVAAAA